MKEISTALLNAQKEMSNPKKGSSNPFFKSKYADLNSVREAVIPVLNAHGISVIQPIVHIDGRNFVKTVLLHESGESIESFIEIMYSKQNDAQAQGSGISYARRYGLQSLVCVGADDDDGEKTMVRENKNSGTTNKLNNELERACNELNSCETRDDLQTTWEKYPHLHKNKDFFEAKEFNKNILIR